MFALWNKVIVEREPEDEKITKVRGALDVRHYRTLRNLTTISSALPKRAPISLCSSACLRGSTAPAA